MLMKNISDTGYVLAGWDLFYPARHPSHQADTNSTRLSSYRQASRQYSIL